MALPFEDSRRLTGANLYFASTGAVLELIGVAPDDALLAGWRARVGRACARLGWPAREIVARAHASGATLALGAPCDLLFLATEVNEWALCATLHEHDPERWAQLAAALHAAALEAAADPQSVLPPVLGEAAALQRFMRLAARECRPALQALLAAATARGLPSLLDDAELTLGAGAGGRSYALDALPEPGAVPWPSLHAIPLALVTGSNGKTTTVRLLAACARARGWRASYSCTDGVFVDGEPIASGDYSGPAGTRRVLREPRTEAAMLEIARGGILRRGLAVSRAHVAVLTNISADHFGEYGIHDLAALADVKLSVGALLPADGLLVLNADDAQLRAKAPLLAQRFGRAPPLGWFALDADVPLLRACRAAGEPTCGVRDGQLVLERAGVASDLGAVARMPLTVGGSASYNIANLAAAALAAAALGIEPATIAAVVARFGLDPGDNPGRMMRYDCGGAQVLLDYAHNPAGLRGLLAVATRLRAASGGRLALLLGHAGNRLRADIEALAAVAAEFRPELIVIKENEAHLRGRPAGEIPAIIHAALLRLGIPAASLPMQPSEADAARYALDWLREGDVLALLVHAASAREAVLAMLAERGARSHGAAPGAED